MHRLAALEMRVMTRDAFLLWSSPVASANAFTRNIYGGSGGLTPSSYTSSRLIGRSVWNSRWKLVIPYRSMHNNTTEARNRFKRTVKDIKLHFVTYSYSGN